MYSIILDNTVTNLIILFFLSVEEENNFFEEISEEKQYALCNCTNFYRKKLSIKL